MVTNSHKRDVINYINRRDIVPDAKYVNPNLIKHVGQRGRRGFKYHYFYNGYRGVVEKRGEDFVEKTGGLLR